MRISSTPRLPVFFRRALLLALVAACSKEPEREALPASAASGSTTLADTTAAEPDSQAVPPQTASVVPPAASKPKIRPSIDPGRKTTPPSPASGDTLPAPRDTPPAAAAAAPAQAAQAEGLRYDASTNTVTFELIGGPQGFVFNGYSSGGATLVLPSKANVVMPFINKDGTPHSAEIISGEGPLPNAAVDAAIPRAYTNQLLQGLPQEGSDVMRFPVPEKGTYRIFCGVPGHGLSGMWIWMKVDPAVKTPSFGPTKS